MREKKKKKKKTCHFKFPIEHQTKPGYKLRIRIKKLPISIKKLVLVTEFSLLICPFTLKNKFLI